MTPYHSASHALVGHKKATIICSLGIYCIILAIMAACLFSDLYPKHLAIKIFALLFFPPVFTALIVFLGYSIRGVDQIINAKSCKYFAALAVVIVVAYLPFMFQPFLFDDDLWGYTGKIPDITMFITYFRCFAFIPHLLYSWISWETSNYGRITTVVLVLIFAWLVFYWMMLVSKEKKTSFVVALLICVNLSMADIIGFLSVDPLLPSLILSVFSVILTYKAHDSGNKNVVLTAVLIFLAVLSIFFAANFYIVATPIVFFLCAAIIYFHSWDKKIKIFIGKYALVMVVGCALFYICNTIIAEHYAIAVSGRGNMVSDLVSKITWLFFSAIPHVVYSLSCVATHGGYLGDANLFWSNETFSLSQTIILLAVAVFAAIGSAAACYLRHKKIGPVLVLLLTIPASIFTFLVLEESPTRTYCLFTLYVQVVFLLLLTLRALYIRLTKRQPKANTKFQVPSIGLAVLTCLIVVSVNIYAQQSWVSYCEKTLDIGKITILDNKNQVEESHRIHVYGSPTTQVLNSYQIYLAKQVLLSCGHSPQDLKSFTISASTDDYYSARLRETEYEALLSSASSSDQARIEQYYTKVGGFYRIKLTDSETTQEDRDFLQAVFVQAELIPAPEDNVVILDYRNFSEIATF